jgi:hypothetical protein
MAWALLIIGILWTAASLLAAVLVLLRGTRPAPEAHGTRSRRRDAHHA